LRLLYEFWGKKKLKSAKGKGKKKKKKLKGSEPAFAAFF